MLLIPAIDLKDGKCVRLQQGDMNASTTFGDDPPAIARRWLDAGARRLHLVDLNGAFAGRPINEAAVKGILRSHSDEIPAQIGCGIRDLDTGREGMLTGVNTDATVRIAQALSIPVIASGGLSDLAAIERLCAVEGEGVFEVTAATAIYTGS